MQKNFLQERRKEYLEQKEKGNKPTAKHPLTPDPTAVGDIQFGECIGRGAFGRVYKGLNFKTGQVVAVKQISKDMLTPSQLPSIMQELKILQTLDHPHITKLYEHHETEDFLFFVMEYVESGSLHSTMKNFGVFPESLLVLYVAQVLQGLAYLHSQDVVHRDIKGSNLLLTKDGMVKLADFGSCTYAAFDRQFTVVGTPFWMAPEITEMSGGGKVSDIWSVGCTVIELLTGKAPFWDLGAIAALFKMVDCPHPPLPEGISPQLEDFLLKCFIRDIKERPGPKELLQHPWIAASVKPKHNTDRVAAAKKLAEIDWENGSSAASSSNASAAGGENEQNAQAPFSASSRSIAFKDTRQQVEELTDKLRETLGDNKRLLQELQDEKSKNEALEAKLKALEENLQAQRSEWEIERDFLKLKLKKQRSKAAEVGGDKAGAATSSGRTEKRRGSNRSSSGKEQPSASASHHSESKTTSSSVGSSASGGGGGSGRTGRRATGESRRSGGADGSGGGEESSSRMRAVGGEQSEDKSNKGKKNRKK
ncbi:Protein kinase of the Mitotic Exit Network [Balamuthia mandrillaris]